MCSVLHGVVQDWKLKEIWLEKKRLKRLKAPLAQVKALKHIWLH